MCGIHGSTFRYSDDCVNRKLSSMNFRGPDDYDKEMVYVEFTV